MSLQGDCQDSYMSLHYTWVCTARRFDYASCITKELALPCCPYHPVEGHHHWNHVLDSKGPSQFCQHWLCFWRKQYNNNRYSSTQIICCLESSHMQNCSPAFKTLALTCYILTSFCSLHQLVTSSIRNRNHIKRDRISGNTSPLEESVQVATTFTVSSTRSPHPPVSPGTHSWSGYCYT